MTSLNQSNPTSPKNYDGSPPSGSESDDFADVSSPSIEPSTSKGLPPVSASPRATDDIQAEGSKVAHEASRSNALNAPSYNASDADITYDSEDNIVLVILSETKKRKSNPRDATLLFNEHCND